jgi:hypothetical protein
MKNIIMSVAVLTSALSAVTAATEAGDNTAATNQVKVNIGSAAFTATLNESPTVAAFKRMLPLTLDMVELNGNEKHGQLAKKLPVSAANPGTIQAGDLMLWQSNTLVLFYQSFRTSYSYTRIARIDDAAALAAAVGAGSVKVTFASEQTRK